MTRIAVIGEALVDVIEGTPHPGGSPVNVAVGLARLGLDVTMATRIGRDEHGRLLCAHLAEAGVSVASGSIADARTSTAAVVLDAHGAATYDFDIVWDLEAPDLAGADIVHVGSIGAYLEPGASVVSRALSAGRGALVSFDPNIRSALIGDHASAVAQTERIATCSRIVKLSDEDAAWLYPGEPLVDVLQRFRALGAALAVATRGADGCLAITDSGVVQMPAPPVVVADTVGAGDAFMSGLLAAIAVDGADLVSRAPVHGWVRTLSAALQSAAVTVSRPGADPPWAGELAL